MPMRIAYYIAYPDSLAGASRSLLELVTHLPSDVQPLVIVPEEGRVADACRGHGLDCTVVRPGAGLMTFGRAALNWSRWQRAQVVCKELVPYTLALARELCREAIDLLHVNCQRGALLAGPAGRLLGLPVVGHLRGAQPALGVYGRAFELLCSRIITVCDAIQADLSRSGRAKAVTVYNGTRDLLALRRAAPPVATRLRWLAAERARGRLVVGCFASLTPFKGQHHLLEAVAELNRRGLRERALFLCLGKVLEADREYEAWLFQRLQELAIDNVTFAGWVDDPFEFYAQTDITVLPSVDKETLRLGSGVVQVAGTEGFPRTHLEAMAMGLPVVATNIAGVPEQVLDGVTGFVVPPRSPSALADALARLFADAELRARMGQAGHARIKQLFTIERCVEGTLAVYRSLLGAESAGKLVSS
jgi:glycosyltransferase involved in cell wall biosynthesis